MHPLVASFELKPNTVDIFSVHKFDYNAEQNRAFKRANIVRALATGGYYVPVASSVVAER